jgi:hypothetical protein
MMLAIDPGNIESAFVVWDGENILDKGKLPNDELRNRLNDIHVKCPTMVIEKVASYGMAVGETIFETVFWSGRFCEKWGYTGWHRVPRMDIKMHLCHTSRAKDKNIRQAIIDRLGEPGTKKNPGKTYGCSKDIWAALALAIFWTDTHD